MPDPSMIIAFQIACDTSFYTLLHSHVDYTKVVPHWLQSQLWMLKLCEQKAHFIQIEEQSISPLLTHQAIISLGQNLFHVLFIKHNSTTSCSPTFWWCLERQQNDKTGHQRVILQQNQWDARPLLPYNQPVIRKPASKINPLTSLPSCICSSTWKKWSSKFQVLPCVRDTQEHYSLVVKVRSSYTGLDTEVLG